MHRLSRLSLLTVLLGTLTASPAPRAQSWEFGVPMPTARADAAVVVLEGKLYVIGGRNTARTSQGRVERFDPTAEIPWSQAASLRNERFDAAAVAYNGRIVLTGGHEGPNVVTDDVEEYVPSENDWESFQNLEQERSGHGAVVLEGRMYALGGAGVSGTLKASCEYYDADNGDWYPYPQWMLDQPRASFGMVEVGGVAYTAGGFVVSGPIPSLERYTTTTGSQSLTSMPTARGDLALVSDGEALYAIGGVDANNNALATVERYDIEQDTWTSVASLNTARRGAVAAYLDGTIYVVGGYDEFENALDTVEMYVLSVDSEAPATPSAFALESAYPNPFVDQTTLTLQVAAPGPVRLAVYDVQGREVATLVDGVLAAGEHRVAWDGAAADGRPLSAGMYIARLAGTGGRAVTKLTLLR